MDMFQVRRIRVVEETEKRDLDHRAEDSHTSEELHQITCLGSNNWSFMINTKLLASM